MSSINQSCSESNIVTAFWGYFIKHGQMDLFYDEARLAIFDMLLTIEKQVPKTDLRMLISHCL